MNTPWDFVVKYYPDYDSCDDIAYNEDLCKILSNEINGSAKDLYDDLAYDAGTNDLDVIWERADDLYKRSNAYIYEEAIKGYINNLNNKENV